jgi:hypothetical protein
MFVIYALLSAKECKLISMLTQQLGGRGRWDARGLVEGTRLKLLIGRTEPRSA